LEHPAQNILKNKKLLISIVKVTYEEGKLPPPSAAFATSYLLGFEPDIAKLFEKAEGML
jgi:hypothetical protein